MNLSDSRVPLSTGLPIIGNLIPYAKDRLTFLEKAHSEMGDLFKLKIGPKTLTVITKPDLVQHVMFSNFNNFIKKTNFDQIFGNSMFIANGKDWRMQRNFVQPLFSNRYISHCIEDMKSITASTLDEYFNQHNDGKDLRQLFAQITFKTILKSIIGLDYTFAYDFMDEALEILTHYLTNDKYSFIRMPKGLDSERKKFDQALKRLDDIIYESIEKAKQDTEGESLVHLLIREGAKKPEFEVTDQFIRDTIVTLMFAGYETSSLTCSWMSYCLAENEAWQDRCIEEALAFDFDQMSIESLKNLPNIEAALFETMRLYPAGWGFTRICVEDDETDYYHFKKDEIILVSPFLSHRSSLYWDEPLTFDPNRFYHKKIHDYGKFTYFPFGAGPRICIGMHLGMIEMKIMMLYVLKQYKIGLVGDKPILDARATIYSKNGYQLKLKNHRMLQ